MIEAYSFGSMTVSGKRYGRDLKIHRGRVKDNWWRKEEHRVDVADVKDILDRVHVEGCRGIPVCLYDD